MEAINLAGSTVGVLAEADGYLLFLPQGIARSGDSGWAAGLAGWRGPCGRKEDDVEAPGPSETAREALPAS